MARNTRLVIHGSGAFVGAATAGDALTDHRIFIGVAGDGVARIGQTGCLSRAIDGERHGKGFTAGIGGAGNGKGVVVRADDRHGVVTGAAGAGMDEAFARDHDGIGLRAGRYWRPNGSAASDAKL